MIPNLNALWARVLMDAMVAMGVRAVCLTPGSRSTPLALASHAHPALETFIHLDERAAAFFALGMAKATETPVALVCTSGTAAANYLPAVIEASLSGAALILLTADRPLELRGSGASQTIDQVRLYGPYARAFLETPVASLEIASLRRLRAGAMHAIATGLADPRGPVHLNVPFQEPLEPVRQQEKEVAELARQLDASPLAIASTRHCVDEGSLSELAQRIQEAERGLIVAGPTLRHGSLVRELALRSGFPLLADIASGLRFGEEPGVVTVRHPEVIMAAGGLPTPDLVVRVGGLPTSAALQRYLARTNPYLAVIQPDLARRDPEAGAQLVLAGDMADTLQRLVSHLPGQGAPSAWRGAFARADRAASEALASHEGPIEALAVRGAIASVPEGGAVFLSSSMPIRYAEALCREAAPGVAVHVSRGANGIDGITSTALGVAAGSQRPTLLVTGDVAFLHDLGGMVGLRHARAPFVVLLLNNDGGGIFSHLPIAGYPEAFETCFGTPHGLRFAAAGLLFGMAHTLAPGSIEAIAAVRQAFAQGWPSLIEVPTDRSREASAYRQLIQHAVGAVEVALAQPEALR